MLSLPTRHAAQFLVGMPENAPLSTCLLPQLARQTQESRNGLFLKEVLAMISAFSGCGSLSGKRTAGPISLDSFCRPT